MTYVRPGYEPLFEGAYSKHVLPSRADDFTVRDLVDSVFKGGTGIGGTFAPFAPRLIRQLLDRAPDPQLFGVCDWQRGLRADEVAVVFGETPPSREAWLLRADEIARAWGLAAWWLSFWAPTHPAICPIPPWKTDRARFVGMTERKKASGD